MEAKIHNIHKLIDTLGEGVSDDVMGLQDMLCDVIASNMELIISFKHSLFLKIQEMFYEFKDIKVELETTRKQLSAKDEELKSLKNCSKCPVLEKELSVLKKKQAVNELRIKSIAKILVHQTPGTQFTEVVDTHDDEDHDQSSVTKAYNLVSQVLGCDDNHSGTDTEADEPVEIASNVGFVKANHSPQKTRIAHLEKSPEANKVEQFKESDEVLVSSFLKTDKENEDRLISPTKQFVEKVSLDSPVLGKSKKTPLRSGGITPPVIRDTDPALGKCQELDYENMYWIPPSPDTSRTRRKNQILPLSPGQRKGKESEQNCENTHSNNIESHINSNNDGGGKRMADFWQLKTTPFVDPNTSVLKKQGTKLKQAKLSLGCFPKKVDLCDIKEFNGGIRPSQTSTQKISGISAEDLNSFKKSCDTKELCDIKEFNGGIRPSQTSTQIISGTSAEDLSNFKKSDALKDQLKFDDDIVMDSPQSCLPKNKRKARSCSFAKKLTCDVNLFPHVANGDSVIPPQMSGDEQVSNKNDLEEKLDNSFDSIKKPSSSPKYKYRDGPVRKKMDRQKLPGWDCDNCRKYYEAAGGGIVSEEEIKAKMNRCSKHRDKNPIRPRTPPGFWDAEFPPTPDCKNLNTTYMDVLPVSKRKK